VQDDKPSKPSNKQEEYIEALKKGGVVGASSSEPPARGMRHHSFFRLPCWQQ
jgi:hypothetical protein